MKDYFQPLLAARHNSPKINKNTHKSTRHQLPPGQNAYILPPALPLPTPTYEVGVNLATHRRNQPSFQVETQLITKLLGRFRNPSNSLLIL